MASYKIENKAGIENLSAIVAVEMQVGDPLGVAERWAAISECPLHRDGSRFELELDNATVRFAPYAERSTDALAAVDLRVNDRAALAGAAAASGLTIDDGAFDMCGLRWRLV